MCSVPGPIFYVQRNQPIEVAWVYNIENDNATMTFSQSYSDCYDPSKPNASRCNLPTKKVGSGGCTYLDPTNQIPSGTFDESYRISLTNIPTSVHIHGL